MEKMREKRFGMGILTTILNILLVGGAVCCAAVAVRGRRLTVSVVALLGAGVLLALELLCLQAPDAAVAQIGAGVALPAALLLPLLSRRGKGKGDDT